MERTQTALLGQQVLYSMGVYTALASGRMEGALRIPGDSAEIPLVAHSKFSVHLGTHRL